MLGVCSVSASEFVSFPRSVNCTVGQDCILNCTFNITAGGGWDERVADFYTSLTEEQIDAEVLRILLKHPNTGYRMMQGFLRGEGIRITDASVMESMKRVDPEGVLERVLSLHTVRRSYSVPAPQSLWHIDGNHKLIRIERLWRDVFICVLETFYHMFYEMEAREEAGTITAYGQQEIGHHCKCGSEENLLGYHLTPDRYCIGLVAMCP
ncbi:UNVERIFIED_CONTAM: hypothetical protein FKN15_023211 [Acipenser sinensis]